MTKFVENGREWTVIAAGEEIGRLFYCYDGDTKPSFCPSIDLISFDVMKDVLHKMEEIM